jgi:hypothetical protein
MGWAMGSRAMDSFVCVVAPISPIGLCTADTQTGSTYGAIVYDTGRHVSIETTDSAAVQMPTWKVNTPRHCILELRTPTL